MYKKVTGIYKIESTVKPERIYIGSAVTIFNRFAMHKLNLRQNKHHSVKLQNHVNKYGIEDLVFEILEECEKDKLLEREQYYLDTLNPYFNICKVARSCLGIKHTEEFKKHNRERQLGEKSPKFGTHYVMSEETKKKLSIANKGRFHRKATEEEKLKNSLSKIGKRHSEESYKRAGDKLRGRKRPPMSEKTKELIRQSKLGKPSWNKGIPNSIEKNLKISINNKGKKKNPLSEKHKLKISEGLKRTWKLKKEKNNDTNMSISI